MNLRYIFVFLLIFSLIVSGCAASDDGAQQNTMDNVTDEVLPNTLPAPNNQQEQTVTNGAPEPDYELWLSSPTEALQDDYLTGFSLDREEKHESYLTIDENAEKLVAEAAVITFSLKVDTAAYSNVARYLASGSLPPHDAVRTEELINYFNYDVPMRFTNDGPFAVYTEVGPSPLDSSKYMAFIRVATQQVDKSELPSSNITFLIDTSGSMDSHDKLPLLKKSFALLVETLDENDVVSIVTYAGSAGVVLDSVSGADKSTIIRAINNLEASGSTAGSEGIITAYALAEKNFMPDGNNRIILASDGDFNVGISNLDDLNELISQKRQSGVYLSVLGFGTGNVRDDIMETLAANGNGNYSYINDLRTANKVLVEELGSNLFTVADDVKAQIEFNPEHVSSYRLIGYENRMLANQDFEDDTKDAGEIGIGTDVVVLVEFSLSEDEKQQLKYAASSPSSDGIYSDELFEVRIRYKNPGETESKLILRPARYKDIPSANSNDFRFACSVAAFAHLLRDSDYSNNITIDNIFALSEGSLGNDVGGYRLHHLELLRQYAKLA